MNVVIYARYSSERQTEQSIEGQLKVCHDFCKHNGYTVVEEYADRAISGTTDNRPAFQKMINDSAKKNFQYVVVYQLDRFARNRYDSAVYREKLKRNDVRVLSARENISDDASGIILESVLEGFAEYFSVELSQKVRRGMAINAEKCLCTGGNIALGYKVAADKHFEIDPDTAPLVQMIFEMYANGKTVTEIIAHLNSLGYKTARGTAFNKNSLHTILKNKRYIGIYTYKGHETPGGMPRIISDELFNNVAEIMSRNKKAPARARAKVEYLLTTKLFCGHCKEMMTGFSAKGKQGNVYNYYICNGRKVKKCDKKMVRKDYIEDLVVTQCRKLLTAPNIERIAKEVNALCEAERDTSNLRFLQKRLAENQRKRENSLNAVLETDSPRLRANLYEKIEQLEAEQERIEEEISKEKEPFPSLTVPKIKFFLESLKNGNVNDVKYRKMLIKVFVNRVFLYDDRITITFNSGDDKITINDRLLAELEENDAQTKKLFMGRNGPPRKKYFLSTKTREVFLVFRGKIARNTGSNSRKRG